MDKNLKTQLGFLTMVAGGGLFLSSFWVEDKQTAVNRRWVGGLLLAGGLIFTDLKKV